MFSYSKITDGIRLMNVTTDNRYIDNALRGKVSPTFGVSYNVLNEMSHLYNIFTNVNGMQLNQLSIPVKFATVEKREGIERNMRYIGLLQGFSSSEIDYDEIFVPKYLIEGYEIGRSLFVQATVPDFIPVLPRPWR